MSAAVSLTMRSGIRVWEHSHLPRAEGAARLLSASRESALIFLMTDDMARGKKRRRNIQAGSSAKTVLVL
jgi:hypothetical protein